MKRTEARKIAHEMFVAGKPRFPQRSAFVKRARNGIHSVGYHDLWGGRPLSTNVMGAGLTWEEALADAGRKESGK